MFTLGGWRSWLLLVLAALVVASYFGVLGTVQDLLDRVGTPEPIQRLASQPKVAEAFKDYEGLMDAYTVMFLFMFLSPLALGMAITLMIFVLSVLAAAVGPLVGGEKIALFILELCGGAFVYLKQELWLPHVLYFLGLVARAYVVITA